MMNSDQATRCGVSPFFKKKKKTQKRRHLGLKLGIFAYFQFSPSAFNLSNLTPGFCQLNPYSLAPFADWSLALDFINLTPNWPQNFNFLAIWPLISIN
jgi:hypothetical protein